MTMPHSAQRPCLLVAFSALLSACAYQPILYDTSSDGSEPTTDGSGATTDRSGASTDAAASAPASEPDAGGGPEAAPGDGPEPASGSDATVSAPRCGNGLVESGEQCDPPGSCPTTCPNRGCTRYQLEGAAERCTAICRESGQETTCKRDDGCCPRGCNGNDDNDCLIVCGNQVKEGSETCDPLSSCPTTCPAQGCQLRKLVNPGTCTAQCVNDRLQTTCASGDGCCPAACNASNDNDCSPACGNGVVERGETCEPIAECTRRQMACTSDQNTIRTGRGSPGACTFECQPSPRPCGPADGACPAGCGADPNCLPRPDSCTHIQFCVNPNQPNAGQVICITNDDGRCTDAERIAECTREAINVCGANHVRPVIYRPPIGGRPSG